MIQLSIGFALAFATTYLTLPAIIRIAHSKHLCDVPGERSSHHHITPTLGGVGIFSGILLALITLVSFDTFAGLQYFIAGLLLIFLLGLKDDLEPIAAPRKLLFQFGVATIIVYACDLRITSMHGLLGFTTDFTYSLSFVVSVFTMLVIMNAFNLIDGINGLAASIGVLVSTLLAGWFYGVGEQDFALVATITAAAYLAYLPYNLSRPARTFMGDSGSLVLGTLIATLLLRFIAVNETLALADSYHFDDIAVVAMGFVIVPLFDTLRVFATRMFRGCSPLSADRRHIHHLLVDLGWSHARATAVLVSYSLFVMLLVVVGQLYLEQHLLLLLVLLISGSLTLKLHRAVVRKHHLEKRIRELKEAESRQSSEFIFRAGQLRSRMEELAN
jgi:UDP-GlcNAc:undecaprenyl-phosphate GlcNAc-1-phosphate transferase